MKKLFFLLVVSLIFFALPVVLVAQSTGDPPEVNPISLEMFGSLTLLAAGILAITAFIKGILNTNGLWTDIISWAIGPVLGIIGWYFKLGLFDGVLWYVAILYGLLAAFYANKGWDLGSVLLGKKTMDYKKAS